MPLNNLTNNSDDFFNDINGHTFPKDQDANMSLEIHTNTSNHRLNINGSVNVTGSYKINNTDLSKSDIGLSNVANTSYVSKPVSTDVQTLLNGKEDTISSGTNSEYYRGDKTFVTLNESAVDLSNADNTSDVSKPVSTDVQTLLNGKEDTISSDTNSEYYTGDKTFVTLNKSAVDLSNVDNTSDSDKPVSIDVQTLLNGKELTISSGTISEYFRGDKTFVTLNKSAVGLSNVDNTSDSDKLVSTDVQTLLNGKEDTISSGTNSEYHRGDKTFVTLNKSAVDLPNVDNTSDSDKPVSTSTQNSLNLKQNTITGSSNLLMNECVIKSNLSLKVKSPLSNNNDLTNAILFQNTGTFYNITLTRR